MSQNGISVHPLCGREDICKNLLPGTLRIFVPRRTPSEQRPPDLRQPTTQQKITRRPPQDVDDQTSACHFGRVQAWQGLSSPLHPLPLFLRRPLGVSEPLLRVLPCVLGSGVSEPLLRVLPSKLGSAVDRLSYDQELGKGTYGLVHICSRNISPETLNLVIKKIDLQKMKRKDIADLVKEAKLLQMFDHPNIVKLVDYFSTPDTLCIIQVWLCWCYYISSSRFAHTLFVLHRTHTRPRLTPIHYIYRTIATHTTWHGRSNRWKAGLNGLCTSRRGNGGRENGREAENMRD